MRLSRTGFNVQSGNWLWGGILDFSSMRLSESRDTVVLNPVASVSSIAVHDEVQTDWLFTARPRMGFVSGNSLIYATGGLAVTELKYAHTYRTVGISISTEAASVSETKAGWTAGGGLEFALDRNWTLNAEYLFADFGDVKAPRTRVQNSLFGPLSTVVDSKADLTISIARVEINYKF